MKLALFTMMILTSLTAHAETPQEKFAACMNKIAQLTVARVESDFPGQKYVARAPKMYGSRDGNFWFGVVVWQTDAPAGVDRGAWLTTTVDGECNVVSPPTPET